MATAAITPLPGRARDVPRARPAPGRPRPADVRPGTAATPATPATPVADDALEALLARAREGDGPALGEVYDRFSPAIFRYLFRRTGDAELAADLTAGVFLKVLEAIQRDQVWRQSFTSWLYRLAQNLLIDHRRAVGRRPECRLPESVPARGTGLEDAVGRRLVSRHVRAAIEELKPEYGQVLLLRFAEGLPHAAVAEKMGKTRAAVKVIQHRALKALRARLDEELLTSAA